MGLWNRKAEEKPNDGQSKSEADQLIERLGATIDEKLSPLRTQVETITNKWNAMEDEAKRGLNEEANRSRAAAEENLTTEEKLQGENRRLLMATLLTNARITETECVDEVKGAWPQLLPRIREVLGTIPMEDKVKPDYAQRCRNAVKLIVGDEAIKGGLRQDRNTGKFLIEDSASKTSGPESPLNDPELTWTDERSGQTLTAAQQLAKLHIKPEDFEKFMKGQAV
jgi:hypothetical protein